MSDVYLARMINTLHGGPVLAAWDVKYLDEYWLATFQALNERRRQEEELQRHRAALQSAKSKWRRNR